MEQREKMFLEVEEWKNSGLGKQQYVESKPYSLAKFNYWINKKRQSGVEAHPEGFREISFAGQPPGKILEIETSGGLKISIFG